MTFPGVQRGSVPAGTLDRVHIVLSEVVSWQLVEDNGSFPHYFLECLYVMVRRLFKLFTVPADILKQMRSLWRLPAQLRTMESPYIGGTRAFIFILPSGI